VPFSQQQIDANSFLFTLAVSAASAQRREKRHIFQIELSLGSFDTSPEEEEIILANIKRRIFRDAKINFATVNKYF